MTQTLSEQVELFRQLFAGYEGAHGQYEIDRTESSGKLLGKAVTHPRAASVEDYASHLAGTKGIGIIPLLKEDKCWFGALDIDIKGDVKLSEDHLELEKKIRRFKLPLMLFRSKSNGAHLYLFGAEPISSRLMQSRLAEFAAFLGYEGCEVFPKQVTRLKPTDYGNWINIPLFGDSRKGIFEGRELSTSESLKVSSYLRISEKELREISLEQSSNFQDGPPCLQTLHTLGIGEGGRNNTLLNVAIYFKKKHEEDWQEKLREYNSSELEDPLNEGEIAEIIKNVSRKEYNYTCKAAPICNYCDAKKCKKRKYGIAFGSEKEETHFVLPITGITKYIAGNKESVRWGVSTTEAMIEFSTEELMSLDAHRRKFLEHLNIIIPNLKTKEFYDQIQSYVTNCEIVHDPEDASETGQLVMHIESWFLEHGSARTVDEMIKKKWWQDPENGNIYFTGDALEDYLIHQKKVRGISKHKLFRIIKERFKGDDGGRLLIKGKRRRVWCIRDFEFEDKTPLEVPDISIKEIEI